MQLVRVKIAKNKYNLLYIIFLVASNDYVIKHKMIVSLRIIKKKKNNCILVKTYINDKVDT